MKYLIKAITIFMMVSVFVACKKNSPGSKAVNIMQGDIYDAKGNKYNIDSSSVTIHISSPDQAYAIEMDDNSHYEQKVTTGNYTYDARASVLLNGKRVNVPLEPLDGQPENTEFPAGPSVTRDFKLSLIGLKPGGNPSNASDYYGGHVAVYDGAANYTPTGAWNNLATKYPGHSVVFHFTGKSNCVDGSISPIMDIIVPVESLLAGTSLVNIPLARYHLTALRRSPAGQQYPLRLTFVAGAYGNHYNLLDFSFSPSATDPNSWPSDVSVAVWED